LIDKSCTLQTGLFKNGLLAGKINKQEFAIHLGIGSKIRVIPGSPDEDNSRDYNRLADGIFGTIEPYDGRWVSYHDSVQTVILDLGRSKTIHSISVRFMEDPVSDINLPKKIEFAVSQNGTDFKIIYKKINKTIPRQLLRNIVRYKKDGLAGKTRFFRLKIENANLNSGDQGKNNYLMDEIVLQ
jgi:hexosaminidase